MNKRVNKSTRRKKSLTGIFLKTLAIALSVFAVISVGAIATIKYYLGDVKRQDVDKATLSINDELLKYEDMKIKNIAVFGLDDSEGGVSRSDAIMVVSVNPSKHNVKMISIARDTYVTIPKSNEKTKINHAYAYGGPELAVATLNENFNLDITDYVAVDFDKLADIINEIGGIEMDVSEAERKQINEYLDPASEKLTQSGYVELNGYQAVSYSRIRVIGGDDARTNRQRNVMEQIFNKLKDVNKLEYPSYIKKLSPMVITSLTDSEMLSMATVVMAGRDLKLEQAAFPNEYLPGSGERINKIWYYVYDLDMAASMLEEFIYHDIPFEIEDNQAQQN